jgi:5-formyltetrahydrofolate cyclo-ligase
MLIGQRAGLVRHARHHQPGVYQPIRREPDLLAAYNALVARGVHLCLPVVVDKDAALEFRAWQPGDPLQRMGWAPSCHLPARPSCGHRR